MQEGYTLPINTRSKLLGKETKTSCKELNREIFTMRDTAKNMKHKYKVLDPLKLTKNMDHNMYGPIQLHSILHCSKFTEDSFPLMIGQNCWQNSLK